MASNITCPRCGAANTQGTLFCVNCGSPLTGGPEGGMGAPGPAGAPPMFPGAVPGMAAPWDMDRQKRIDRTRTGILLLLIGSLIGWIPIIQILGSLLLVIGAILVILGRKAFGPTHSRFVIISIVVAILGFVTAFFAGLVIGFSFAASSFGGTPTQAGLQAALTNSLIVAFVGTVIAGIASVLFTFALQNQMGKILLVVGYVASIGVQAVIILVLLPLIPSTVAAMFPNGTFDQTAALAAASGFSSKATVYGYLSAIPALIFAAADYIAWTRIKKGEIPAPPTAPGMGPMATPIQPR